MRQKGQIAMPSGGGCSRFSPPLKRRLLRPKHENSDGSVALHQFNRRTFKEERLLEKTVDCATALLSGLGEARPLGELVAVDGGVGQAQSPA